MLVVEPFPRRGRGNVRLVLVIRGNDFDRLAEYFSAEILDRHLGGGHRADAGDVRVDARHVLDHADFHDAVGNRGLVLGLCSECAREQQCGAVRRSRADLFIVTSWVVDAPTIALWEP